LAFPAEAGWSPVGAAVRQHDRGVTVELTRDVGDPAAVVAQVERILSLDIHPVRDQHLAHQYLGAQDRQQDRTNSTASSSVLSLPTQRPRVPRSRNKNSTSMVGTAVVVIVWVTSASLSSKPVSVLSRLQTSEQARGRTRSRDADEPGAPLSQSACRRSLWARPRSQAEEAGVVGEGDRDIPGGQYAFDKLAEFLENSDNPRVRGGVKVVEILGKTADENYWVDNTSSVRFGE